MAFYDDPPQSGGALSGSGQSTEKSIKSCYAVVYELDNRKWVVAGEGGWSEVHLCEDSMDNSHRILAWTVKSQQVLMNCNVTSECTYKEKSKNFHSFSDENGNRYGLGFHKSDSGLKQATHFLKSVISVIDICKQDDLQQPPSFSPVAQSTVDMPDGYSNPMAIQPGSSNNDNNVIVSGGGMPPPNPYQQSVSLDNNMNNNVNQPPPMFSQSDPNDNNNNYSYSNNQVQQPPPQQQQPPQPAQPPPQPVQPLQPLQAPQSDYKDNNNNDANLSSGSLNQMNGSGSGSGSGSVNVNGNKMNLQPTYHLRKEQHKSLPAQPIGPLGHLKILPPKQQKHFGGDAKIKNPTTVEHKMRVTHDKATGLYSGLPKEWMEHLNKQFGVKPNLLDGIKYDLYDSKIPKVLTKLRSALEDGGAFKKVGIFRLAPNASDNKSIKDKINKGQLKDDDKVDANIYANLLKVWFRDLPDPLLNCVNPDLVEHVASTNDAKQAIKTFPEPNKSIFLWLCDMCVDIAKYKSINKMGPQNMAIVVGPNLFNTDKFENPMKAMTYSGKVVEFFKHSILWREQLLSNM